MNKLTRLTVCAFAALTMATPIAAASAAPHAQSSNKSGNDWTVVEKGFKAKQQACKKSVDNGGAWRIFNRLDSSKVTGGRLRATMTVLHNNHTTNRSWESGWVREGTVSDVGTVVIPREPGYSLAMSLAADQAGNGGALTAADIGHC